MTQEFYEKAKAKITACGFDDAEHVCDMDGYEVYLPRVAQNKIIPCIGAFAYMVNANEIKLITDGSNEYEKMSDIMDNLPRLSDKERYEEYEKILKNPRYEDGIDFIIKMGKKHKHPQRIIDVLEKYIKDKEEYNESDAKETE